MKELFGTTSELPGFPRAEGMTFHLLLSFNLLEAVLPGLVWTVSVSGPHPLGVCLSGDFLRY